MFKNETTFTATAPSNIAFVKYWGKRDAERQWPANDSLSMTLEKSVSTTSATISGDSEDAILFDGKKSDTAKAQKHLDFLRAELNFHEYLKIDSKNSFPSACGIASSASGMAALTIAAIGAWTRSCSLGELEIRGFKREDLAQLARIGSGSASRSLWGGFVHWAAGRSPDYQSIQQVECSKNKQDWDLADIIVVLSSKKKEISSTEAHKTAWSSPMFRPRLSGIEQRFENVLNAIETKNLPKLGELIETEALEMHSVMMTSTPAANYWCEETPRLLEWVREQRKLGGFDAWFTIDAGPNVHLICEKKNAVKISEKLRQSFDRSNGKIEIIVDQVGSGPKLEMS